MSHIERVDQDLAAHLKRQDEAEVRSEYVTKVAESIYPGKVDADWIENAIPGICRPLAEKMAWVMTSDGTSHFKCSIVGSLLDDHFRDVACDEAETEVTRQENAKFFDEGQ